MPRPDSVAVSDWASRSTLALYPPAKPRSLVMMTTAARDGSFGSVISGWSTCRDPLTTASTARVSSRAYGAASRTRCWALMLRDEAISSWARVILAVDCTVRIRRLTARSCAPIACYLSPGPAGSLVPRLRLRLLLPPRDLLLADVAVVQGLR